MPEAQTPCKFKTGDVVRLLEYPGLAESGGCPEKYWEKARRQGLYIVKSTRSIRLPDMPSRYFVNVGGLHSFACESVAWAEGDEDEL